MVKSLLGMYWGVSPAWRFSSGALQQNEQMILFTGIVGGGYPLSVYTIPPNTQAIIWILWALK